MSAEPTPRVIRSSHVAEGKAFLIPGSVLDGDGLDRLVVPTSTSDEEVDLLTHELEMRDERARKAAAALDAFASLMQWPLS